MWSIISSVISGVLSPLFTYLNKKEDVNLEKFKVNGEVDKTLVAGYVEQLKTRRDLLIEQQKTAGGRWMHYLFVYPLGFWFAAIIFYCIFHPYFPSIKPVLDVPPIIKEWGGYIVGFLVLVSKIDTWVRRT